MSGSPSPLGLGCWAFGGVGAARPDPEASRAIIARAAELGVTHLDTAADYGVSEEVVGAAAAPHPGRYFIATKTQLLPTAAEAVAAVERSRARLGGAAIDLFYIHWPRTGLDPAPMMEGLEACRARGEIRFIGVSNFSVADMEAASRAGKIDFHQLCWNLLWRRNEAEIAPWCSSHGIGITVYSPLAQGLLTASGGQPSRRKSDDPRGATLYYESGVWPRLSPIVAGMRELAASSGSSLGSLALRWVLSRPGVLSVLVGASGIAQLEANVAAASEGEIDPALLRGLEELSSEADSVLPKEEGNIFLYKP